MKNSNYIKKILFLCVFLLTATNLAFAAPKSPDINGTLLPAPKKISAFHVIDDNNQPFDNQNLKGHWTFMFFGFSRCHDVCPDTLSQLNQMYNQWKNSENPTSLPQVVFVTVDPNRDTPTVLHHYVKSFNSAFIGLRGDQTTLEQFKKGMKVYFAKVPKGNDYSMEHSSQIFIINPEGDWVGILNYPFKPAQLIADYKAITSFYKT